MLQCRPRHHDDLTRLNDAGRHIHPLTGQEIQLTQEPPGSVANDAPLLAVGTDHDLGGSRADRVEVVGRVPFPIEVLAHGHRPSGSERLEKGQLSGVECGKRDGVIRQGQRGTHGFDLLAGSPVRCSGTPPAATILPHPQQPTHPSAHLVQRPSAILANFPTHFLTAPVLYATPPMTSCGKRLCAENAEG